jgi:hypothetical protein
VIVVEFLRPNEKCVCNACHNECVVPESAENTDDSSTIAIATLGDQSYCQKRGAKTGLENPDYRGKNWGMRTVIIVVFVVVAVLMHAVADMLYTAEVSAMLFKLAAVITVFTSCFVLRKPTRNMFLYKHRQSGFLVLLLLFVFGQNTSNYLRIEERIKTYTSSEEFAAKLDEVSRLDETYLDTVKTADLLKKHYHSFYALGAAAWRYDFVRSAFGWPFYAFLVIYISQLWLHKRKLRSLKQEPSKE